MNDLEKDYKVLFLKWYEEVFKKTSLYTNMRQISENSPWHREENVAVHTNMVVEKYLEHAKTVWDFNDLCGAVACAFHDVGKPDARTECFSEKRGKYFKYSGHELISARLWEDWAVSNWKYLNKVFGFNPKDIFTVGWMVENHLPWNFTKKGKNIKYMVLTLNKLFGDKTVFYNFLRSDVYGRISDDAEEKRKKTEEWFDNFDMRWYEFNHPYALNIDKSQPTLYVMIGAAGTGKSTFTKKMKETGDYEVHSLDALRLLWYTNPKLPSAEDAYRYAFDKSCEDPSFKSKANNEYMKLIRSRKNIILDNINTSRKRRGWYINLARNYGYNIVAVIAPVSLKMILERQNTRGDKCVPLDAVKNQYMKLVYPSYGEFDDILVEDWNIHK